MLQPTTPRHGRAIAWPRGNAPLADPSASVIGSRIRSLELSEADPERHLGVGEEERRRKLDAVLLLIAPRCARKTPSRQGTSLPWSARSALSSFRTLARGSRARSWAGSNDCRRATSEPVVIASRNSTHCDWSSCDIRLLNLAFQCGRPERHATTRSAERNPVDSAWNHAPSAFAVWVRLEPARIGYLVLQGYI